MIDLNQQAELKPSSSKWIDDDDYSETFTASDLDDPSDDSKALTITKASTEEELHAYLNGPLTYLALQTYKSVMLSAKDPKLRKEAADAIMNHSSSSAKSKLPSPSGSGYVNIQINKYLMDSANQLLKIAEAASEGDLIDAKA